MIFQHTINAVLDGSKTQTRRLMNVNGFAVLDRSGEIVKVCAYPIPLPPDFHPGRTKWQVGKTYAAQPGRGQPAVARIKVLRIRREDVREISYGDAEAEGYNSVNHFMRTWCEMYDPGAICGSSTLLLYRDGYDDRYQAWVLDFELVGVGR